MFGACRETFFGTNQANAKSGHISARNIARSEPSKPPAQTSNKVFDASKRALDVSARPFDASKNIFETSDDTFHVSEDNFYASELLFET